MWTVKVGKAVEHIDAHGKSKAEEWDALRWAFISKGIPLSDESLMRLMDKAKA